MNAFTRKAVMTGMLLGALVLAAFIPANARLDELILPDIPYENPAKIIYATASRSASVGGVETRYRVREGDSLWALAARYGVDVATLAKVNGLTDQNFIRAGQVLTIPGAAAQTLYHFVQPGETLWDIARKYQVTVSALTEANDISNPDFLVEGQRLAIPLRKYGLNDIKALATSGWGLLRWPLSGRITSPFGMRDGRPHEGVDIAGDFGDSIRAARAGRVTYAGPAGTYGLLVILDHGDGLSTYYAHCQEILVKCGEYVDTGQLIARVGATGRSQGPHLHFEVRYKGCPYDPLLSLPATGLEKM